MFCCSVALFHCFGTTYFCNACHDEYCRPPYNVVKLKDCGGVNCPLGVPHPPANSDPSKSTFPLGCGLCRSKRLGNMKESGFIVQEVSLEAIVYQRQALLPVPIIRNVPARMMRVRRPIAPPVLNLNRVANVVVQPAVVRPPALVQQNEAMQRRQEIAERRARLLQERRGAFNINAERFRQAKEVQAANLLQRVEQAQKAIEDAHKKREQALAEKKNKAGQLNEHAVKVLEELKK